MPIYALNGVISGKQDHAILIGGSNIVKASRRISDILTRQFQPKRRRPCMFLIHCWFWHNLNDFDKSWVGGYRH
jgi:hypothetical protein